MARAFLFVLDSVGIGGADDADEFGDKGSNTIGHIAAACAAGGGWNVLARADSKSQPVGRLRGGNQFRVWRQFAVSGM